MNTLINTYNLNHETKVSHFSTDEDSLTLYAVDDVMEIVYITIYNKGVYSQDLIIQLSVFNTFKHPVKFVPTLTNLSKLRASDLLEDKNTLLYKGTVVSIERDYMDYILDIFNAETGKHVCVKYQATNLTDVKEFMVYYADLVKASNATQIAQLVKKANLIKDGNHYEAGNGLRLNGKVVTHGLSDAIDHMDNYLAKINAPMQVRITNRDWFSSDKKMNEFLVANRGKLLNVQHEFLFDDQYNVEGYRVSDKDISEVKNDKRGYNKVFNDKDFKGTFNTHWNGIKPEICLFESLGYKELPKWEGHYTIYDTIKKGFHLSYSNNDSHYVFSNSSGTNFKFVYRDGVFYEHGGIGYKKLKSLSGKVRADAIKPLTEFFKANYIESSYTQFVTAGCEVNNHCSDLYVPCDAVAAEIITKNGIAGVTKFVDQITSVYTFDIPFLYPYYK